MVFILLNLEILINAQDMHSLNTFLWTLGVGLGEANGRFTTLPLKSPS